MSDDTPLTDAPALVAYAARMRALPVPTAQQYQEFAWHVCTAHSWYKHLSLVHPAEFVVFLDASAGTRAGSEPYTHEHMRLHHAWKTTGEYRHRFGHLDYAWRAAPGEPWSSDDGDDRSRGIPPELRARWSFCMYPYASMECPEVIVDDVHAESMRLLEAGLAHPARDGVLAWHRLVLLQSQAWNAVSDDHREQLPALDGDSPRPPDLPAPVAEYLENEEQLTEALGSLHLREREKIDGALARLDAWLRALHTSRRDLVDRLHAPAGCGHGGHDQTLRRGGEAHSR